MARDILVSLLDHMNAYPAWIVIMSAIGILVAGVCYARAAERRRFYIAYKASHRLQLKRGTEDWRKLTRQRAAELRAVARRMDNDSNEAA